MKQEYNVYTLKEVQDILSVSQRTLYYWIKSGRLKATKVGRQYRVTKEALDALLQGEDK